MIALAIACRSLNKSFKIYSLQKLHGQKHQESTLVILSSLFYEKHQARHFSKHAKHVIP